MYECAFEKGKLVHKSTVSSLSHSILYLLKYIYIWNIKIWRFKSCTRTYEWHTDSVSIHNFVPDGKIYYHSKQFFKKIWKCNSKTLGSIEIRLITAYYYYYYFSKGWLCLFKCFYQHIVIRHNNGLYYDILCIYIMHLFKNIFINWEFHKVYKIPMATFHLFPL